MFYDQAVIKQVDVPSFSGSFGILPKHVPTLAVLKPGVVTVYEEDGQVKKVFVSSGTVTINEDNSVQVQIYQCFFTWAWTKKIQKNIPIKQVLAEEAHPLENLDGSAARDILSKAQQQLSSASSDKDKAEAAIAVEVGEALVQALNWTWNKYCVYGKIFAVSLNYYGHVFIMPLWYFCMKITVKIKR